MIQEDYKGWHIIIARNYGHTTINAYSDKSPVKHLAANSIQAIKLMIDKE